MQQLNPSLYRAARHAIGLKTAALAELAGVSVRSIQQLEMGQNLPRAREKITRVLQDRGVVFIDRGFQLQA
jgi:DNA-binding transcriptional regulator YiaG